MTRNEIEKLESWLHDGVHMLCLALMDRRDSLLDAATGVFSRDPIPTPKRKPGRPRKASNAQSGGTEVKTDDETTQTCPYCNRVLPSGVIELHKDNCRAAAEGYTTRVGQRDEP